MPDGRRRHPLLVVVRADRRGREVDDRRITRDGDGFAERADLERDSQLDDRADADRDPLAPERAESPGVSYSTL